MIQPTAVPDPVLSELDRLEAAKLKQAKVAVAWRGAIAAGAISAIVAGGELLARGAGWAAAGLLVWHEISKARPTAPEKQKEE